MTRSETKSNDDPVQVTLSESQMNDLAVRIGAVVAAHPPTCRAFSAEEILWFKGCHSAVTKTKSVMLATTVGFIVLGVLGLLGVGIIHRIRQLLGQA